MLRTFILTILVVFFTSSALCHGKTTANDLQNAKDFLKTYPESAEACYQVGAAYADLGMYSEARDSFQLAVSLKPDYADAYYGLGVVYYLEDNGFAFLEEYGKLKTLDPSLAENLYSIFSEKRTPAPLFRKKTAEPPLPPIVENKTPLPKPETSATPLPAISPKPDAKAALFKDNYFSVQIGFFIIRENAVSLVEKLLRKKYDAFIHEEGIKGGKTGYRVLVGRYATKSEAEKISSSLSKQEHIDATTFFVGKPAAQE